MFLEDSWEVATGGNRWTEKSSKGEGCKRIAWIWGTESWWDTCHRRICEDSCKAPLEQWMGRWPIAFYHSRRRPLRFELQPSSKSIEFPQSMLKGFLDGTMGAIEFHKLAPTVCRFISLKLQLTPCSSRSFMLLKFRNWGWWACLKVWNGEISSKVAPDSTDVIDHQAGITEYQEWMWVLGYMGFFRQWSISFNMASVIVLLGRHCEDCPLESGDLWLIPPKKLISLPHGGPPILSPSTFPYVSQLKTRLTVLKAVGALRH